MSLFTESSLCLVPSGVKVGKVYSIKPTDGSGDLTFTRSNDTATRVGPDGLIQKVRTNNLPYSEAFDNAAWIKQEGASVVANVAANPLDGALTADRLIIPTTANSRIEQVPPTGWATSGQLITLSCYIKGFSGSGIVGMRSGIVGDSTLWSFNPSTWTRVTWTKTAGSNYEIPQFCNGTLVAGADASVDILAFGFQIELGDIATNYIATTTAAVSVGPVANLPRLDYLGSSCGKLLLEPQRTNLALYSEQFDNAAWAKNAATITANGATSPDGSVNADKFLDTTANDGHYLYAAYTISVDTTFSIFVKSAEYTKFAAENLSDGGNVIFNLSTESVVSTSANYKNAKIQNYGNGWYRVSATTNGVSGSKAMGWGLVNNAGAATFVGTGTSGVFVYGFQAEAGAYETSYIGPTFGSAVTRGQESSSKTSASALIGQTEGTLYSEFIVNGFGDYGTPLCINNGTTGESVWLTTFANGDIRAEVFSTAGGGVQASFTKSGNVVGQTYKIAIGYAVNNFSFFVNGVQVGATDLLGTIPVGMNRVDFDYIVPSSFVQSALAIKQALLFKTRLTNAQLAELTA
jgi:hypothetical protein